MGSPTLNLAQTPTTGSVASPCSPPALGLAVGRLCPHCLLRAPASSHLWGSESRHCFLPLSIKVPSIQTQLNSNDKENENGVYLVSLIVFLNSLVMGALKPPFLSKESIVWIWSQSGERRDTWRSSHKDRRGMLQQRGEEQSRLLGWAEGPWSPASLAVQGKSWRHEIKA